MSKEEAAKKRESFKINYVVCLSPAECCIVSIEYCIYLSYKLGAKEKKAGVDGKLKMSHHFISFNFATMTPNMCNLRPVRSCMR